MQVAPLSTDFLRFVAVNKFMQIAELLQKRLRFKQVRAHVSCQQIHANCWVIGELLRPAKGRQSRAPRHRVYTDYWVVVLTGQCLHYLEYISVQIQCSLLRQVLIPTSGIKLQISGCPQRIPDIPIPGTNRFGGFSSFFFFSIWQICQLCKPSGCSVFPKGICRHCHETLCSA